MDIGSVIQTFAHDDKLKVAVVLIVLDFIFGVGAALKLGTFRLSYVADFLRNDVLGKVVPWFAVYAADVFTKGANVVVGIDLGTIAGAAFAALTAAMVASIIGSIRELGLPAGTLDPVTMIAGGENAAPPKSG